MTRSSLNGFPGGGFPDPGFPARQSKVRVRVRLLPPCLYYQSAY